VKDPEFINQMIERGEAAREKARKELEGLSETQLNWKPDKDSWSIGQCLDHLIVTDSKYIPAFQQIADRTYHMRSWEKWSPFSGLFGKMLVRNVGEIPRRKMKAPRVIRPTDSKVGRDIMERFHAHLDKLLDLLSSCRDTDIDKIKITSPVSAFFTYSMRHAIQLIMQHEHRHLNQAVKVRNLMGMR
jgi:hypothetical protein